MIGISQGHFGEKVTDPIFETGIIPSRIDALSPTPQHYIHSIGDSSALVNNNKI